MTGRGKKDRRVRAAGGALGQSSAIPPAQLAARLLRWIPALVLLLGVGVFWLRERRFFASAPEPIAPADVQGLDPEVRRLVEQHLQQARAEPSGANHGTLGLVYEAQGMWREAERCFAAAAELDEDPLWTLHQGSATASLGDVRAAAELFRRAADGLPDSAAAHYRLADALVQLGALDEAVQHFETAVRLAPENSEGHAGLGAALYRKEAYEEARTHLAKAVELDPTYRTAHYQLGTTLRALGREEEAARELALGINAQKRAIPDPLDRKMRSFTVGYSSRVDGAVALLRSGRTDEALGVLEEVSREHPSDVGVLNNLAVAYLKKGDAARARALLDRARALDERAFATWINLTSWGLQTGELDQALAWANRAVELAGEVGRAHQVRGEVLAKKGRWNEAYEALKKAAQLDAREAGVHRSLAIACAQLARYDEARACLVTATGLDPRNWAAHLDLCEVNMALGDLERARAALSEARELAPGNAAVESVARKLAKRETEAR
jgi:tetratricopeptide (TPR) repeat protein